MSIKLVNLVAEFEDGTKDYIVKDGVDIVFPKFYVDRIAYSGDPQLASQVPLALIIELLPDVRFVASSSIGAINKAVADYELEEAMEEAEYAEIH